MSAPDDNAADPRTWLRFAESGLSLARLGHDTPGALLEDLCFHAQQAAEKALKGLLIARAIDVPRTHAIATLLDLLAEQRVVVPNAVKNAAGLTTYAVRTRYPGGPGLTEEDYLAALKVAEDVVAWVRGQLDAPGNPGPPG